MARSNILGNVVIFLASLVVAMAYRPLTIGTDASVDEGACAYGNLFEQGYGLETAALSTALFNNGLTYGACFEIKCVNDPQWCIRNAGTIKITATNFCPSDYTKTKDIWCNPPQKHSDLSMPMFVKLANYKAGIIPLNGNPHWTLVLLFNVGGAGDIVDVKVKGSQTGWLQMCRNWRVNWQVGNVLTGQSLSFQVTTSDHKTLQFNNVIPANWKFSQTHGGKLNF
ncbi:hypothetical protein SLE2022_191220 [Rubroshorea leprosula]